MDGLTENRTSRLSQYVQLFDIAAPRGRCPGQLRPYSV